ncbi:MAG: hypothetical protein R3E66_21615 [bacterium]
MQADFAVEAASAMGLPTVGGTALGNSLADIGRFATLFTSEISTQQQLVDAVRAGEFYAVAIGTTPIRTSERPERRESSNSRPPREDRGRRIGGGRRDDRRGGGGGGGGGGRDRGRSGRR